MDEVNNPRTGGDPSWPTEPLWPAEPAPPVHEAKTAAQGSQRRARAGTHWAIGIGAVVALAAASVLGVTLSAGGKAAAPGAVLTGSGVPGGSGSRATGGANGNSQGAAAGAFAFVSSGSRSGGAPADGRAGPRACVASARHLRAMGHEAAARARLRACARRFLRTHPGLRGARARLARLAFLARHAMHGQVTVATKNGPKTIAFERGTVESVSGASVVVKAADGVTWTWQVGTKARVFDGGSKVGASALADGQRVAIVGLVTGGTDQARRVLIHVAAPGQQ